MPWRMMMSEELRRLVQIEGYEKISDWDLNQIATSQLNKRIVKFEYDINSLNEAYLGIVFHDNTYIYGVVICDGSCGNHDPHIDFESNGSFIDYKAAYQMGLIDESQYESCQKMVEESSLDFKRRQLERLKRELGES